MSKTIKIAVGKTAGYVVTKVHYIPQSGSYTMGDAPHTVNVNLSLEQHTFTINPTPSDATVVINGVQRSTITADYGSNISWSVSKSGYVTQNGITVLQEDTTLSVSLAKEQYTYTIVSNTPGAVIYINDEERSSITDEYGVTFDWKVTAPGYKDLQGNDTITGNYTETINLDETYLIFKVRQSGYIAWVLNDAEQSPINIEYSVDGGFEWNTWTPQRYIGIDRSSPCVKHFNAGDEIYLRGNATAYGQRYANGVYYHFFKVSYILESSGGSYYVQPLAFDISGDITALLDVNHRDPLDDYAFFNLFDGLGEYTFGGFTVDVDIDSTDPLVLPSRHVGKASYFSMFSEADNVGVPINNPPIMKAESFAESSTLGVGPCSNMFNGCHNLKQSPVLYVKTLTKYCYWNMFAYCTSLSRVTCLATDISAYDCTSGWLSNGRQYGTFVKDANTTWERGTSGIPTNWTVVDA